MWFHEKIIKLQTIHTDVTGNISHNKVKIKDNKYQILDISHTAHYFIQTSKKVMYLIILQSLAWPCTST